MKKKWWDNFVVWFIIIAVFQVLYAIVVFYCFGLSIDFAKTWSNAGSFGDIFGCLSCLFSGLAFAGLIVTIRQQRHEIELQHAQQDINKKEFELQLEQFKLHEASRRESERRDEVYRRLEYITKIQNNILHEETTIQTNGDSVVGVFSGKRYYSEDAIFQIQKHTKECFCRLFSESMPSIVYKGLKVRAYSLNRSYANMRVWLYCMNDLLAYIDENFGGSDELMQTFNRVVAGILSKPALYLLCIYSALEKGNERVERLVRENNLKENLLDENERSLRMRQLYMNYITGNMSIDAVRQEKVIMDIEDM